MYDQSCYAAIITMYAFMAAIPDKSNMALQPTTYNPMDMAITAWHWIKLHQTVHVYCP